MSEDEFTEGEQLEQEDESLSGGLESTPWKDKEFFSPEDAVVVWDSVKDRLGITDQQELVFVSPTSNIPTHEYAIFEHEADRSGPTRFITGDKERLNPKLILAKAAQLQDTNSNISFEFQGGRDAQGLLRAVGEVDIIWDRKGKLWYDAVEQRERAYDQTVATLLEYGDHLKKGGAVVIDDDPGTEDRGALLRSTGFYIDYIANRDPNRRSVWDNPQVAGAFDAVGVGEGKYKVLLLVKK